MQPPPPELSWSKQSDGIHVLHLTAENFKAEVKKKKHALIIFYVPCKFSCFSSSVSFLNVFYFWLWQERFILTKSPFGALSSFHT